MQRTWSKSDHSRVYMQYVRMHFRQMLLRKALRHCTHTKQTRHKSVGVSLSQQHRFLKYSAGRMKPVDAVLGRDCQVHPRHRHGISLHRAVAVFLVDIPRLSYLERRSYGWPVLMVTVVCRQWTHTHTRAWWKRKPTNHRVTSPLTSQHRSREIPHRGHRQAGRRIPHCVASIAFLGI